VTIHADAQTLFREAVRLERTGRAADAAAAYERLLERWPNHPDSWYNLARLQRHAGRFEAALASYAQALARGVARPEEVHLNRGVIFSDCLRREDDARRELQAALALNPAYVTARSRRTSSSSPPIRNAPRASRATRT
jgi:tetratricopeptide (TPR) repeat protein